MTHEGNIYRLNDECTQAEELVAENISPWRKYLLQCVNMMVSIILCFPIKQGGIIMITTTLPLIISMGHGKTKVYFVLREALHIIRNAPIYLISKLRIKL